MTVQNYYGDWFDCYEGHLGIFSLFFAAPSYETLIHVTLTFILIQGKFESILSEVCCFYLRTVLTFPEANGIVTPGIPEGSPGIRAFFCVTLSEISKDFRGKDRALITFVSILLKTYFRVAKLSR